MTGRFGVSSSGRDGRGAAEADGLASELTVGLALGSSSGSGWSERVTVAWASSEANQTS